ncbi:hypothetical protein HU200_013952 [Digitaria exilis]|uniref:CCHC-type domain-containing protein n=1 Tax=Digitaria exilis TaxID=1010633 RepID=A0A835FCT8_9POAL|nr:hypothetical protein HU200_013952 [Digitaria exilis]
MGNSQDSSQTSSYSEDHMSHNVVNLCLMSKKKRIKSKKGEIQKIEESSSSAKELDLLKANYASLVCKYESLEKDYTCATQSLSCVALYEKSNEMLTAQLDKITTSQYSIEHVFVETCDGLITQENQKTMQEVNVLKGSLSELDGNGKVQPSQDNRDNMVNKLEERSTAPCSPPQQHLKISKNKVEENNKLEHIKSSHCSTLGNYAFSCPTKLKGEKTLSKKNRSLSKKRVCYGCKEKGHLIAVCPNVTSVDATGDRRLEWLSQPVRPPVTQGEPHQGSNKTEASPSTHKPIDKQDQLIQKVKVLRKVKCKICYSYRQRGHMSKDCPNGNSLESNLVQYDFNRLGRDKVGTCATRVIDSPQTSIRTIWIPKHLVTNLYGPNKHLEQENWKIINGVLSEPQAVRPASHECGTCVRIRHGEGDDDNEEIAGGGGDDAENDDDDDENDNE